MDTKTSTINIRITIEEGLQSLAPLAVAVAGYSKETCESDPYFWLTLIHHEDRELIAELQKKLKTGHVPTGPHSIRWKHCRGHLVWTELWLFPVYQDSKEGIAVEAVARDVTWQKNLEHTLRLRNRELEIMNQLAFSDDASMDINSFLSFSLELALSFSDAEEGGIYLLEKNLPLMVCCSSNFNRVWAEKIIQKAMPESLEGTPVYSHELQKEAVEEKAQWALLPLLELGEVKGFCLLFGHEELQEPGTQRLLSIFTLGVTDGLARKRKEEAYRISEERYREIVENIQEGYYEVDLANGVVYFNNSFCSLLGYSRQELLDIDPRKICMDMDQVENICGSVLLKGEREKQVLKLRRKDGRMLFVELILSPLQDSVGNIRGLKGLLKDITDKKEAEARLASSEWRFSLVADFFPGVIYLLQNKPRFPVLYVNDAVESLLGYAVQDFLDGKLCWLDLLHPEDLELFNQKVLSFLEKEGGEHFEIDVRLKDRQGNWVWTKQAGQAVLDHNNELEFIEGFLLDITGQKKTEDRLSYLNSHDELTGLFNRSYFENKLQLLEQERCFPVSVITCDIDGLKEVNDTLGHEKGDEILISISEILRKVLRSEDIVARIGGDEIGVILPGANKRECGEICRRILSGVKDFNQQFPQKKFSISLGMGTSENDDSSLLEIYRQADNNMYKDKLSQKKSVRSSIIETLMVSLGERDFITQGHAERLEMLATRLGEAVGLASHEMNDLVLLSKLHDIGKIGVPDQILFKQGKLTRDEWEEMKKHCEIGYRIAKTTPDLTPIAEMILQHHEWWNGAGYPQGLKGKDIHICSRILSIVDAYDAMTSVRPYQTPRASDEALLELERCRGTQFDPHLVDLFIDLMSNQSKE